MTIAVAIRIKGGEAQSNLTARSSNVGEMRALLEQIMILEKQVVEKLIEGSNFKEFKKK